MGGMFSSPSPAPPPQPKPVAPVEAAKPTVMPTKNDSMARRTKNQLRRMPQLSFYGDDSLDYIDSIDSALKGKEENPIENPDILNKPQKK